MEKYILILLSILIILISGILFIGYNKVTRMSIELERNSRNITAVQSLLSNHDILNQKHKLFNNHILPNSDSDQESNFDSETDSENEQENDLTNEIKNKLNDNDNNKSVEIIISHVEKNLDQINEPQLNNLTEKDVIEILQQKEIINDNVLNTNVNITELNNDVEGKMTENVVNDVSQDIKIIEFNSKNNIKKTYFPNANLSTLEVGYITVSENDGKTYEVTSTKTGIKKWKLHKK